MRSDRKVNYGNMILSRLQADLSGSGIENLASIVALVVEDHQREIAALKKEIKEMRELA